MTLTAERQLSTFVTFCDLAFASHELTTSSRGKAKLLLLAEEKKPEQRKENNLPFPAGILSEVVLGGGKEKSVCMD